MKSMFDKSHDKAKDSEGPRTSEGPADGPARVVKPGDWGAVADKGLKGFHMTAFSVPGRVQPKPDPQEERIAELTRETHRLQAAHRKEAEKSAHEAEAAARAALERGREEGRREGESQAWEKYSKALEDLQKNTRNALVTLSREKAALFLAFEAQAVELAALCVRRVFEDVAEGPLEAVLPLLKKAVAALGDATSVILKVNPADFATVEENKPFWLPVDAGLKDLRIVPDARIAKGGCFVECDSTSVEVHAADLATRIEEELKKVFEAKLRALENAGAAEIADPEGDAGEGP